MQSSHIYHINTVMMTSLSESDQQRKHFDNAIKVKISLQISDVIANLDFLKKIDDHGHLYYEANFVRNSIRRYERFWIPIVIKLSDNQIDDLLYEPPLGKYCISWIGYTLNILFLLK